MSPSARTTRRPGACGLRPPHRKGKGQTAVRRAERSGASRWGWGVRGEPPPTETAAQPHHLGCLPLPMASAWPGGRSGNASAPGVRGPRTCGLSPSPFGATHAPREGRASVYPDEVSNRSGDHGFPAAFHASAASSAIGQRDPTLRAGVLRAGHASLVSCEPVPAWLSSSWPPSSEPPPSSSQRSSWFLRTHPRGEECGCTVSRSGEPGVTESSIPGELSVSGPESLDPCPSRSGDA